jgi:CDP-paratose 2-epimerase
MLSANNEVVVFDNLRRRGSELTLSGLNACGARFVHGDIRNPADLDELDGTFDILIEASAEPSVHAGIGASPKYVFDTNLGGALNCIDFARRRCGACIFLSTSRVYAIDVLSQLPLMPLDARFDLIEGRGLPAGVTREGVSERFPTEGRRSYYGTSKLAAELIFQEYAAQTDLKVLINRCGVIAGPGQYGKTDQGVFALWVARHYFRKGLKYKGFGGTGWQVRDLLHPADLCELIAIQISAFDRLNGQTFNVGGGKHGAVSLAEYTRLCQEEVGNKIAIEAEPETNPIDIPWYITDNAKIRQFSDWSPRRSPREVVRDIVSWLHESERDLERIFL